jgi:hypothetical protein
MLFSPTLHSEAQSASSTLTSAATLPGQPHQQRTTVRTSGDLIGGEGTKYKRAPRNRQENQ